MKKTITYFSLSLGLFAIMICSSVNLKAQSKNLPYKTGWDNTAEQNGWTLHQLKSTAYSAWAISSVNAPSAPNFLSHDYPVGNSHNDVVEDWYVSPALNVPGSCSIALKANVYIAALSNLYDYFGLWYSTTSSDPASGKFKEIVDFTPWSTTTFSNWHDTAGIWLNDSGPAIYFALKYKESTNWFTVGVDNLNITLNHTGGIENGNTNQNEAVTVYPNPTNGSFSIQLPQSMAFENSKIGIFDLAGKEVLYTESKNELNVHFDGLNLAPGMYQYRISNRNGLARSGKLIITD